MALYYVEIHKYSNLISALKALYIDILCYLILKKNFLIQKKNLILFLLINRETWCSIKLLLPDQNHITYCFIKKK
jgi:hypothetical protein